MWPTHAPVQARTGETTAQGAQVLRLDPEPLKHCRTAVAQAIGLFVGFLKPARFKHPVMQQHGQGSRHVVVAGAGKLQAIRGPCPKARRGVLADHHQCLQGLGHAFVRQAVIAMTPLNVQPHQRQLLELGQVGTGGRRADFGHRRQFGAGAGMTVHQRTEDFRPRRLSDGCRHLRDADVVLFCAHISLPDESMPFRTGDSSNTFQQQKAVTHGPDHRCDPCRSLSLLRTTACRRWAGFSSGAEHVGGQQRPGGGRRAGASRLPRSPRAGASPQGDRRRHGRPGVRPIDAHE
ncbi:hypothetical protein D3C81_1185520 [compost metagenome]